MRILFYFLVGILILIVASFIVKLFSQEKEESKKLKSNDNDDHIIEGEFTEKKD